MSWSSARNYYYALKKGGDWSVFIPESKLSKPAIECRTNNKEFRTFLLKLAEGHHRNSDAAINKLWARWRNKKPIPAYNDFEGHPALPRGWSKKNLRRIIKAEQNEVAMRSIRNGTSSKTNPHLPQVFTTRKNLWVGAVYQIDDMWHDHLVTVGKNRDLVRVIELGALDLFSGCRFHWGAKPRLKKDTGGYENLKEADTRLFIAALFHQTGYSPRGTMLMAEHGTAAIRESLERILYDASGGLIRVERQAIEGKQQALSGFWNGTEGGNFHAKAALESLHSKIHNDLAHLPMQTGLNHNDMPVVTKKQKAYIESTVKRFLKKAPEHLDKLRLPSMDFHTDFIPLLHDYYTHGLNSRTDHNLEGWRDLGFHITEYTTTPNSDLWLTPEQFLALPEVSQQIIRHSAQQDPKLWSNKRNLSPLEVWKPASRDLITIPDWIVADILTDDLAAERKVKGSYITFQDQNMPSVELIYKARILTPNNIYEPLPSGETYKVFANPFEDRWLFVHNARGQYLGKCELYKRNGIVNDEVFLDYNPWEQRRDVRSPELIKAAGEKHALIAEHLEDTRIRNQAKVDHAKELRAFNKRLEAGDTRTAEERKSDAGKKAAQTRFDNEAIDLTAAAFDSLADQQEEVLPDLDF
eukprot:Seg14366.1 transcript_id=Seg14366.1/GoldUCD/mRNA.D3Y31 product="hypothetical protein" protein_id=Seg14366.1/GoldUCD/D3Y31